MLCEKTVWRIPVNKDSPSREGVVGGTGKWLVISETVKFTPFIIKRMEPVKVVFFNKQVVHETVDFAIAI